MAKVKFVVFYSNPKKGEDLAEAKGYLQAFLDKKVLGGTIVCGNIKNSRDIADLFEGDKELANILSRSCSENKHRYAVIRVGVIDDAGFREFAPLFCKRHEFAHELYEVENQ